jgi:hypothetical protein
VTDEEGRTPAVELLTAEYQYVSGLIPYYRGVEMLVLAGTGIVASAALAASAALMSGENPRPSVAAIVLVAAAWGPALLLMVEATALVRIRRASLFIREKLYSVAEELTGRRDVLTFEHDPAKYLRSDLAERGVSKSQLGRIDLVGASVGIVAIPVVTTGGMAAGGVLIDGSPASCLIGSGALACALTLGWYSFRITHPHEKRQSSAGSSS